MHVVLAVVRVSARIADSAADGLPAGQFGDPRRPWKGGWGRLRGRWGRWGRLGGGGGRLGGRTRDGTDVVRAVQRLLAIGRIAARVADGASCVPTLQDDAGGVRGPAAAAAAAAGAAGTISVCAVLSRLAIVVVETRRRRRTRLLCAHPRLARERVLAVVACAARFARRAAHVPTRFFVETLDDLVACCKRVLLLRRARVLSGGEVRTRM